MAPPLRFECPKCNQPVEDGFPLCRPCGALVPPPLNLNHFELLGCAQDTRLDEEALQTRFYSLLAQVHPDQHGQAGPEQIALATQWATLVNRAYRILKDPDRRTRYLLELKGHPPHDTQAVPVDLAELYFEIQEHLEEPDGKSALRRFETDLRKKLKASEENFPPYSQSNLEELQKHLTLRRFLRSMLEDVERKTEAP